MRRIKLARKEMIHLLDMADYQTLGIKFGPHGCYITNQSPNWVIVELAKLRGIKFDENALLDRS